MPTTNSFLPCFKRALWVTLLAILACSSFCASGAEFVSFGGFSRHFERDLDLNEFNPGIGYEKDYSDNLSWSAGVFKNSLRRAAFYGTVNYAVWQPAEGLRIGATAGLSTGYHHAAIVPMAMPFVEWRVSRFGVQAYVIPTVKPYVDGAVVVQFKWRID
ncbi:MAG: hypothetical protein JWL63_211 [Rhodocyclales bacterium]|nr:hypothetical protein [Rhodocyclales bacterium]